MTVDEYGPTGGSSGGLGEELADDHRVQPEPETEQSLEGQAELGVADFRRIWWLVPGARRARTALFPLAALSVMFALVTPLMGEWVPGIVLALVTSAPYFSVAGLGLVLAWRRVRALGAGPVVYRLSGRGLEVRSSRHRQTFPWSSLRGFIETPEAWVIEPHRGKAVLLPKRAFTRNFEHVGWQLRRRLELHLPPNWGLRFGFGVGALLAFLTLWHFYSLEPPRGAEPSTDAGPRATPE